MIGNSASEYDGYDFLMVVRSNFVLVSRSLLDIAKTLCKIVTFSYPFYVYVLPGAVDSLQSKAV